MKKIEQIKDNLLDARVNEKVSKLFKTISDPTRIRILYALRNETLSVTELTYVLEMTQSAVSHQLRILRDAQLVKTKRAGKEIFYSLLDNHVHEIFSQAIDHVMEDNNEK